MIWPGLLATAVLVAALAYWHLVIAEGAYLGSRVVAWTYDWIARRYDAIKQYDARDEDWYVAGPLLRGLARVERPLILDVATGTGRVPLALLRNRFPPEGRIVGLDLSWGMLRQAWAKLQMHRDRVQLIWQDAGTLPFEDGTFDAVVCLEALEFLPNPLRALAEMERVLAPGGVLFLTNRVGAVRWLLPGRAIPREAFLSALAGLGLQEIEVRRWQVDYDLAVARKSGPVGWGGRGDTELEVFLRCPVCAARIRPRPAGFGCIRCGRAFPVREGIVALAVAE